MVEPVSPLYLTGVQWPLRKSSIDMDPKRKGRLVYGWGSGKGCPSDRGMAYGGNGRLIPQIEELQQDIQQRLPVFVGCVDDASQHHIVVGTIFSAEAAAHFLFHLDVADGPLGPVVVGRHALPDKEGEEVVFPFGEAFPQSL